MKNIELLAPCGNMDSLKAAVSAGCDAVYLGLTTFSARAFAGNFTHDEFIEAVSYCHIRDVKVYVTMNTLLFETEIENAIKEIQFLYENDVDAVLIQDLGLFHICRTMFPDLEVHASTQMHIHNIDGAMFLKKCGASRVVLARETPLSVVKEVTSLGIETEVFSYGAICISYSGQCLMSESVKHRSGNRGMCAQLCRLKYYDDFKEDGEYLLSPKDLNVINEIPELIEAGVASLKIEGRMKRPEYVYLVVKTFREAIDAYYAGKKYTVSEKRNKDLLLMFNRGFSKGHLFNASVEERMSHYRPNHLGVTIGTVLDYKQGKVRIKLTDTLYQHDGLRILNEPVDTGLTAVRIYKNGLLVNKADKGDIVELDCNSKPYPKKGQLLQKTSDSYLISCIDQEINESIRRVDIEAEYEFIENKPARLTVKDYNGNEVTIISSFIVQKAQKAPLDIERIKEQIQKAGEEPYRICNVSGKAENIFLPIKIINELRREALVELSNKRKKRHTVTSPLSYDFVLQKKECSQYRILVDDIRNHTVTGITKEKESIKLAKSYPIHENKYETRELKDFIVSEAGTLNLNLEHCIAGMNLNIANSYACAFVLAQKGIDAVILSSECNDDQIEYLIDNFTKRYGFVPPLFKLVYGKRIVMYIKNGFSINQKEISEIEDLHHNTFEIQNYKNITEVLESDAVCSNNTLTYGNYIILSNESNKIKEDIIGESYEEIFNRI